MSSTYLEDLLNMNILNSIECALKQHNARIIYQLINEPKIRK